MHPVCWQELESNPQSQQLESNGSKPQGFDNVTKGTFFCGWRKAVVRIYTVKLWRNYIVLITATVKAKVMSSVYKCLLV